MTSAKSPPPRVWYPLGRCDPGTYRTKIVNRQVCFRQAQQHTQPPSLGPSSGLPPKSSNNVANTKQKSKSLSLEIRVRYRVDPWKSSSQNIWRYCPFIMSSSSHTQNLIFIDYGIMCPCFNNLYIFLLLLFTKARFLEYCFANVQCSEDTPFIIKIQYSYIFN